MCNLFEINFMFSRLYYHKVYYVPVGSCIFLLLASFLLLNSKSLLVSASGLPMFLSTLYGNNLCMPSSEQHFFNLADAEKESDWFQHHRRWNLLWPPASCWLLQVGRVVSVQELSSDVYSCERDMVTLVSFSFGETWGKTCSCSIVQCQTCSRSCRLQVASQNN